MNELVVFFGLSPFLDMYWSGDWARLATFHGLMAVLYATLPTILLIEAVALARNRQQSYGWASACYAINRIVGLTLSVSVLAWTIGMVQPYQMFSVSGPVGFVYAYLVWELAHYVYHRSAHRCRLLWCLHAAHHAPEDMHLMVGHAHHVLEGPYAEIVRPTICLLLGVPVPMLLAIMAIDGIYGWAIHVSPQLLPRGRFGRLEGILLSPADHRVHHARNARYIDKNYCNLLAFWDRVFGSYTPQSETPDYGITRKPQTFASMYFGEARDMIRDVYERKGIAAKVWTILGPPDWRPAGPPSLADPSEAPVSGGGPHPLL